MKKFTVKIKGKTFGEIPNGTIFKPIGSDMYYMKIQTVNFNAVIITTGYLCSFHNDEKIEKTVYRFNENGFLFTN